MCVYPCVQGLVNRMIQKGMVKREELVTIANLGRVRLPNEIVERIVLTSELCGLEEIDAVVIKIDKEFFTHKPRREVGRFTKGDKKTGDIVELVQVLEKICRARNLHFYGIHSDFPPYSYHTPPMRSISDYAATPRAIEESMQTEMRYGDFMIYQISPTTALPPTFSMLEPSQEWLDVYKEEEEEEEGMEGPNGIPLLSEATRTYTRGSLDPLLCYPGRAPRSHDLGDGTFLSQQDMNKVNSRLARILKKEEERYKKENDGKLPPEIDEMKIENIDDNATEDLLGDTEDQEDGGAAGRLKMNVVSMVEDGVDETGDNINHEDSIPLLSGMLPAKAERLIGKTLNSLCPHLMTTPRLQDKALRVIFSTGVDVMVVDAMSCALIGKLALRPSDLLPISATEKVFGTFMIEKPKKNGVGQE